MGGDCTTQSQAFRSPRKKPLLPFRPLGIFTSVMLLHMLNVHERTVIFVSIYKAAVLELSAVECDGEQEMFSVADMHHRLEKRVQGAGDGCCGHSLVC